MGYGNYDGGDYGGDYYGGGGDYYGGDYYGGGYYDGYYGYYDGGYDGYDGYGPTNYVPEPIPTTGGGYYIGPDGPTVGVPGERPDDDPPPPSDDEPWFPPRDYYAYYGYRGGGGSGGGGASSDENGERGVEVERKGDHVEITVTGFNFKFLVKAETWDDLGRKEAVIKKILGESNDSLKFDQALAHLNKEEVRNIYVFFDQRAHLLDGTERSWKDGERGLIQYERDSSDGTDIRKDTDVYISINRSSEGNNGDFGETFIHELMHPATPGISVPGGSQEEEMAVRLAARAAYTEIFRD